MKWKHRTIHELSGGSLSGNLITVGRALNHNAYLLKEAVQHIDELEKRIEELEKRKEER